MKKMKSVVVMALVAVLVFALAACGNKDGGSAAKYEGEVAETVIQDKIVVKYPAAYTIDQKWSDENSVCLRKDGETWEVTVYYGEYGFIYEDFAHVESDHKLLYGDRVEKTTLLGKEGFKVDQGAAITINVPADDNHYLSFSCKVQFDKEADYQAAFKSSEVQFILENLSIK